MCHPRRVYARSDGARLVNILSTLQAGRANSLVGRDGSVMYNAYIRWPKSNSGLIISSCCCNPGCDPAHDQTNSISGSPKWCIPGAVETTV
jgi:hypothetical protein